MNTELPPGQTGNRKQWDLGGESDILQKNVTWPQQRVDQRGSGPNPHGPSGPREDETKESLAKVLLVRVLLENRGHDHQIGRDQSVNQSLFVLVGDQSASSSSTISEVEDLKINKPRWNHVTTSLGTKTSL